MAITAKQLAKLLGISEASVSMALNGKPGVSEALRDKVVALAKEHGYDFSRVHENLYADNVYMYIYVKHGAVIGDTPFFNILFKGADVACKNHRLKLNMTYVSDMGDLLAQMKTVAKKLQNGILLLATEMSKEELARVAEVKAPVVIIDTSCNDIPFNYVAINNKQGAFNATSHLIRQYRSQPGYLRSEYAIANFAERADGFYGAIRAAGMSASRSAVHLVAPSIEGAYADVRELLNGGEKPARCYFADNDLIAAGAIKAFQELGYKVPKDVAVIGFDDIPLCTLMTPQLSSVNVPKQYLSFMAIERLLSIIKNPNQPPVTSYINTSLIVRASTDY